MKNCMKCQGRVIHFDGSDERNFEYCNLCRGIWITKQDLIQTFRQYPEFSKKVEGQLDKERDSNFQCVDCGSSLKTGLVKQTRVVCERCTSCEKYFFDLKELDEILNHLEKQKNPTPPEIDFTKEELQETNLNCPVCGDEKLMGLRNRLDLIKVCTSCEGLYTKLETLQELTRRSLFGTTMFEFRKDAHLITYCRNCGEVNHQSDTSCSQCGHIFVFPNCQSCDSRFTEYELSGLIIERCQICNDVWLDQGEFEKVLLSVPDLKREAERSHLRTEIGKSELRTTEKIVHFSLEQSKRQNMHWFFGRYGVFLYSKFM